MGIVLGHLSVGHIGRSMYLEQATPAIGCWQGSAGCDAGLGCSPKQVMAVAQSHPSTPHLLAHPPLCHAYTLTFASTKEPNEPTCLPTLVPYIIMHLPIYKGLPNESTHLPSHLPIFLPSYVGTYASTYLPRYLSAYLPVWYLMHLIYLGTYVPTHTC